MILVRKIWQLILCTSWEHEIVFVLIWFVELAEQFQVLNLYKTFRSRKNKSLDFDMICSIIWIPPYSTNIFKLSKLPYISWQLPKEKIQSIPIHKPINNLFLSRNLAPQSLADLRSGFLPRFSLNLMAFKLVHSSFNFFSDGRSSLSIYDWFYFSCIFPCTNIE